MSVLDTLKNASARTREVTLCVDGALQAEYERLKESLEEAAEKDVTSASLADPGQNVREAVEALAAVEERMQAALVTFKFRQLPWTQRLALQAEHPPRDGNIGDGFRGYNVETFIPVLIRESCASVVGADGDEQTKVPAEVWDTLLAALNFQQVNLLSQAALTINDQDTQVPTSARFLLESQDSEASSEQPSPGTSPRSGSEGGSRRGSRKSSATKKAASSA